MKIILPGGLFAIVDDDADLGIFSHRKWKLQKNGYVALNQRYGPRKLNKSRCIYLHRLICGAVDGQEVDHINHDKLDNRRDNLRVVSSAENHMNLKMNPRNTSGFTGVTYDLARKKWMVALNANGKCVFRKRFTTAEEAARAYDEAKLKFHGAIGEFNFPRENP